ncbi:DMT family transporter [Tropicimonas isoalkanivorans]|uniref:Small multidrug resistance pump n=1 Tax=Tropicimonas isoalkanivorans TaxID=441112 RepID=A0A1I1IVQ3_9RHOB|nr:multidrug efflux SMR transporter [Tropicimonas isoalkanivorans]SFC37300.1 small multidrug resistance pump [Tropicimonas isoalkanivorans]
MPAHVVALIGAIVTEVIGTAALQASQQLSRLLPTLVMIGAYSISVYLLSTAMKIIPVGVAYAIWSGLGMVLITVVGFVAFKQRLDAPAVLGLALIVTGVAVIQLFSQTTTH